MSSALLLLLLFSFMLSSNPRVFKCQQVYKLGFCISARGICWGQGDWLMTGKKNLWRVDFRRRRYNKAVLPWNLGRLTANLSQKWRLKRNMPNGNFQGYQCYLFSSYSSLFIQQKTKSSFCGRTNSSHLKEEGRSLWQEGPGRCKASSGFQLLWGHLGVYLRTGRRKYFLRIWRCYLKDALRREIQVSY